MAADVGFSEVFLSATLSGTSVYLWLLSLGSGLLSSYRLPMSFNRKTFFLLWVKLGPPLPRPACFLFEFFCMFVFWIFLQRFLILDHISVTVCAFSSCVLSLGATVLGRQQSLCLCSDSC